MEKIIIFSVRNFRTFTVYTIFKNSKFNVKVYSRLCRGVYSFRLSVCPFNLSYVCYIRLLDRSFVILLINLPLSLSLLVSLYICLSVCLSVSLSFSLSICGVILVDQGSRARYRAFVGTLNQPRSRLTFNSWWKPITLNYASFIRNHYPSYE